AEREGFEPSDPVKGHLISSEADSAALAPLQVAAERSQARRGRDSNPRRLAPRRFSRAVRSSTPPPLQVVARGYRSAMLDRSVWTHASAARHLASASRRTASPWAPAAG